MTCQVAVITDIHDAKANPNSARQGEFGHVFLLRTVHRLNRYIRPDVVVILGDLIDQPDAEDARERLERLKKIIDRLDAPTIVIPGNHDPDPDEFYNVFSRPDDVIDIKGVRFLPFIDPEEPGYNASRKAEDLDRMRRARQDGHTGPVVSLQHVPVLPPGTTDSPYGYTNIDDIMDIMDEQAITLAVSGHYHAGAGPVQRGKSTYFCGQALCESPFSYALITLEGTAREPRVNIDTQAHKMPKHLRLFDYHSHTQFAYCAENMHMDHSSKLAELFGLEGIAFTEHSGQLYFERPTYSSANFCFEGINGKEGRQNRMDDYWHTASPYRSDRVLAGLEVDADYTGNLVLKAEDREKADVLVGAVHYLPEMRKEVRDAERLADEFLKVTDRLVRQGIDTLAHPFRVFRRSKVETPPRVYKPVAHMLKETGVAAEINYHTNEPEPEFFTYCLEIGVKVSFGSDSHNLYEVGEFMPHLALLENCGYDGDIEDILYRHSR